MGLMSREAGVRRREVHSARESLSVHDLQSVRGASGRAVFVSGCFVGAKGWRGERTGFAADDA